MAWPRALAAVIVLALAVVAVALAPAGPAPLGSVAQAHPEPGDIDGDTVPDVSDNCITTPNGSQLDKDGDGQGDACDADDDNDGLADASDNCRLVANPDQADADGDGRGDACPATDRDGDGRFDEDDNCILEPNPDQADLDGDDKGDACDRDDDGDRYDDGYDNCPTIYNPDQADADGDRIGSACDADELIAAAPPPDGPGTAADVRAPSLTVAVQRRQRLDETGPVIVVTATCSEACTLDAVVSATGQAARRARLGRTRLTLARGSWSLAGAGRTYVFARLTSTARRLRAGRRLVATAQLSATDAAGNRSTQSRPIELRR
jgi:hypothetical protein